MAGDSVMNCRCRARMTARACGRGRRAGSSLQTHVLGAKLISYRANSTGASGRYRAGTYCPRPGTSDSASSTIRHVRCRRRNTAEPHISAGSARRRRSRRLPGRQRMRRDRRRHRDNSGGGGNGSRNSDFHDSYAYCHARFPPHTRATNTRATRPVGKLRQLHVGGLRLRSRNDRKCLCGRNAADDRGQRQGNNC